MQKFTIQIRGNVLIKDQAELEKQMREVLSRFPNFTLKFSSVEVWTDENGKPREYEVEPTEEKA